MVVILMVLVGCIGYNTYLRDGLSSRFKSDVVMNEADITTEREKYWTDILKKISIHQLKS